ncbi:MAG: outer membrane lipoprotein-sorting protein [Spirosomataceae bacterium]
MKKITLSVIISVLSFSAVFAQTVDEIVAHHLNAFGGAAKLREVKTLILENTIKVQGLEFENRTTLLVNRAMRSDSKIMGNELVQAFDGTTPWEITPILMGGNGQPQVMAEETAKSVITQIDPFPLLDYAEKGTKLAIIATEKVKGKEAHHLKMWPKNGNESEIWINAADGFMSKLKTVQNGQEVEVTFSEYVQIEGLNFAMRMETSNPMAGTITIDTKTVKLNPAIDALIFKMPTHK